MMEQQSIYQQIDLNHPHLQIVSTTPPIYLIDDFLNHNQCQALIECTKDHMIPAPVVGAGNGEISNAHTSSTCYLLREDVPNVIDKVNQLLQNKSKYHVELPQREDIIQHQNIKLIMMLLICIPKMVNDLQRMVVNEYVLS